LPEIQCKPDGPDGLINYESVLLGPNAQRNLKEPLSWHVRGGSGERASVIAGYRRAR